jgi:hypothetical protein
MKTLGIILLLAVLASLAFADSVPNYFPIQGRLMNATNATIQGTNSINFSIYNVSSGGTPLYSSLQSITTSSDGIYAAMLTGINLSFNIPYFLGITVGSNSEMAPRTNLSTAPFAYRANISDWINPNNTLFSNCPSGKVVQNVTTGGVQCISTGGSGTVTQVNNGTGILGGPITATGTLSVDTAYTDARYQLTNASLNWSYLQNFPSACGAGNAVTGVGSSLTCGAFLTFETDPLWSANFSNFSGQITRLVSSNGSIYVSMASLNVTVNDLVSSNTTMAGRVGRLESSNGSIYVSIASLNVTVNDLVTSNGTMAGRVSRLESSNGSIYTSLASLNVTVNDLVTSNGTTIGRISRLESSNGSIYISISALNTSTDGRLTRLESSNTTTIASIDILNATMNASKAVAGTCPGGQAVQSTSNNSAPTCVAYNNGSGSVTSVSTGLGVYGGPISTSGTINLDTNYTDQRYAGTNLIYFLFNASSDITNYTVMNKSNTSNVPQVYAFSSVANGDNLTNYTSNSTIPFYIAPGVGLVHINATKTAGSATVQIQANLWDLNTSGGQYLIASSNLSGVLTATNTGYDLVYLTNFTWINASHRLALGFNASVSGGTAPTINLFVEGNLSNVTASRIQIPIASSSDTYTNANIESVAWSKLIGFPAGCSGSNAITTLGTVPSCAVFIQNESDPLWSGNFSNTSDQITRLISSNTTTNTNLANNFTYSVALNNNITNVANNLSTNATANLNNWTNQSLIDGNLTQNWTNLNGRANRLESSNTSIYSLVATLNTTTSADNTTIFNRITNNTNVLSGVNFTNASGYAPINFSITNNGLIINTTIGIQNCNTSTRGAMWVNESSSGDYFYWCGKNSSGSFIWVQQGTTG